MKTVGIVQARMTSTRLPGKILKTVLGKPLLEYELERLNMVPSLDVLMVATTTNTTDDPVVELCKRLNMPVYRGSEHDVLSRYYEAATEQKADAVVRFTADCPLIDPGISDSVIRHYIDNADDLDYCAVDVSTYPRGMDTEAFSMKVLKEAFKQGHEAPDREHVTHYIHTKRDKFRVWMKESGSAWGKYRLTVDTPEDFELIKEIIERLYPQKKDFSLTDVVRLLEGNPSLAGINDSVEQKKL
ncbi:glycosyltransferase family protein [Synergistaceae bacterium OttesenSCG-928-I11]|nr:glycosyltransferase family protein [Synergistaceae bacterium OttesenSCG-928-I11]